MTHDLLDMTTPGNHVVSFQQAPVLFRSMIQPRCLLVLLLLLSLDAEAQAQQNRLLPTDDWAYATITRLQRRGHLLDLNPTAPPYRHGDVLAALAKIDRTRLSRTEQHWIDLLERAFKPVEKEEDEITLGYMFQVGARTINSDQECLKPSQLVLF